MKIVVINGAPRAGKDTFVEICKEILGDEYVLNVSTVDFVKSIAYKCGWNGVKDGKNRKFLSDLKDLLTEWDDVPFKKVNTEIQIFQLDIVEYCGEEGLDRSIAFIHCREPEEIQKFKDRLHAHTVLVRREQVENEAQTNHADSEVFNFAYDSIIYNNGTLDDLKDAARCYLTEHLGFEI
jgi:dephospho-CoA kinase